MKKFILLALLGFMTATAQETDSGTALLTRSNEVRIDLLSLVASSKFNLTYERFLSERWSSGLALGYSASQKLDDDFDSGHRNNLPKYEVNPFVRYKLSESLRRYYFAEVFTSINGGDFKEIVRRELSADSFYYTTEKSAYSDIGVGAGLGYKMYLQDRFAVELIVAFGTNLLDKDKSPDTLSRVGLSFGYRF
jgi:hypothetical protein